jgi:hypothetical protein
MVRLVHHWLVSSIATTTSMTVAEGLDPDDADMDWDAAAEMLEAVKLVLYHVDPTHSQVEKEYPGAELWRFGWMTEPGMPLEARRNWTNINALVIAKGAVNILGRGRRILLTAVCTTEGSGTVTMRAKPVPVPRIPPGGAEELGPQMVREVVDRLGQLGSALSLSTVVPEGQSAEPNGQLFRILSPPSGIGECVSSINRTLDTRLSYLLRPNFTEDGHFHIEAFELHPIEAD